ncbi:MAG TPA: M90 family metallopeptidase [Gammaproteobacteria bacterium]
MPVIILIVSILIIGLIWFGLRVRRQQIRDRLKAADFNSDWIKILQDNLGLYNKLPDELRHKLHGLINVFLHEKIFSGYNGLDITDEIRVTIAAQACLLLLNRDDDLYPTLKNIYVYPGAFQSEQAISDGVVTTIEKIARIGESFHRGHVVLSWEHSKQGAMDQDDGHNVVYHEFAHQLDHADGAIDGTPVLDGAEQYRDWSRVFSQEFFQLREKIAANKGSVIDAYGTVSEGEFFAVVTELFFERPQLFSQEHPRLYEELRRYYRLNPIEWFQ